MITAPTIYHAGPNGPYRDRPATGADARRYVALKHGATVPAPVLPWKA